jgi:hypothetical protein
VVQVIVADVAAILPAVTALIVGTGTGVEKVKLAEVPVAAKTAEMTAKL